MRGAFLVVLTTLPSLTQGRQLAKLLLQKKLAACVNILGPADSLYWWKGKIDSAKEHLVLIKTCQSHFNRLRALIEKNHPYTCPEIIALPIARGNASYLNWVQANVR